MNKFTEIAKIAERVVRNNSSSILTALGVTGTLTTAYLTVRATVDAVEVLENKHQVPASELRPMLRSDVKYVWKLYIPAGLSVAATISCIIGAAKISSRRTAAITAAYSISERAYSEYREKVVETLGVKKEQKVRDEIAANRILETPPSGVVMIGTGDVLCYEMYTGRYFNSNMESLRKAQNDVNAKLVSEMEATLSDFYYLIGLPQTSFSSYSGWKSEKMMDLSFSTVLHEGKPCLAFEYNYVTTI